MSEGIPDQPRAAPGIGHVPTLPLMWVPQTVRDIQHAIDHAVAVAVLVILLFLVSSAPNRESKRKAGNQYHSALGYRFHPIEQSERLLRTSRL